MARISYDNSTIKVTVHLSRPMRVKAGQYINVWIPWASIGSVAQTHPFTVTSWSNKPQKHLDLFIEPRRGFTKHLFDLSHYGPTTSIAMFSGPHGKPLPLYQYENILLLATGFGIAAHLPYLKKLIYDQKSEATSVRRIHLVWQIERRGTQSRTNIMCPLTFVSFLDVGIAAQKLLNEVLNEDLLEGEDVRAEQTTDRHTYLILQNLRISIYIKSESIHEMKFGDRAMACPGEIPLKDIILSELRERRATSKTVFSSMLFCTQRSQN